jgi:hypothetical protein
MPNCRQNNAPSPAASPARFESLETRRLLAAPYGVHLTSPWSHAVFQRDGNNAGYVQIEGSFSGNPTRIEARAVVIGGEGKGVNGNTGYTTGWTKIAGLPTGGEFSGTLVVRAGGWYRIQVRGVGALGAGSSRQVRNIGVGDVFFLAGQSIMEGASASSVSNDDHVSMAVYDWEDTTQDNGPAFAHLADHVGPAPHGKAGPAG